MIRFCVLVALLLFIMPAGWCLESVWVECVGDADLYKTSVEEARSVALRNARLNAIEKACGVRLQSESMVHDYSLAGDFINSVSYGEVIEEEVIEWETIIVQPSKNEIPNIKLRVHIKANVVQQNIEPDPSFLIRLDLNKSIFQSGEELIMTLSSTKECYLTILNITANNEVIVLLPNEYHKENKIAERENFIFPSEQDRANGIRFRVSNIPGHRGSNEIIKVIATKQRIDFLDDFEKRGNYGYIPTQKMAMTSLARWLSGIPLNYRAEATATYKVVD